MDSRPNPSDRALPAGRTGPGTAAVAALAVLVASAVVAGPGRLVAGERPLFEAVNGLPDGPRAVSEAVMAPGTTYAAAAVGVVALLARRWRLAVHVGLGWLVAWAVSPVLKDAVGRPRPSLLLPGVVLRQDLPAEPGYPSSHAALAAALAVALAAAWPRWWWAWALVATAVALARLYVGVHLPLDVAGGAAVGVLAGLAAGVVATRGRALP